MDDDGDDTGSVLTLPRAGDEKLVHSFEVGLPSASAARILPFQLSAVLGIPRSAIAVVRASITTRWRPSLRHVAVCAMQ